MGQVDSRPGILVVDDEHAVRVMVQLALERCGFDTWVASSGQEAIRTYRQQRRRIALVLLDVCMPGLDGPATMDALRELNHEVCVCFMSGDLGCYEVADLLRRGAAHVIAKPFRLDELVHVLGLMTHGDPVEAVTKRRGDNACKRPF